MDRTHAEQAAARLTPRATRYRGILMRSRLEATFAANLDRLGADWVYEPSAFGNAEGQYLPDFWLPEYKLKTTEDWAVEGGWYIEVRPVITGGLSRDPRTGAFDILWRMERIWPSNSSARLAVASPSLGNLLVVREPAVSPKAQPMNGTGWFTSDAGGGSILTDSIWPIALGITESSFFPIDWEAWR